MVVTPLFWSRLTGYNVFWYCFHPLLCWEVGRRVPFFPSKLYSTDCRRHQEGRSIWSCWITPLETSSFWWTHFFPWSEVLSAELKISWCRVEDTSCHEAAKQVHENNSKITRSKYTTYLLRPPSPITVRLLHRFPINYYRDRRYTIECNVKISIRIYWLSHRTCTNEFGILMEVMLYDSFVAF